MIYHQSTGTLTTDAGETLGAGYSGIGPGYNNPAMEAVKNVGPIPRGRYAIGPAFTHALAGPVTMRLLALPGTDTFGRDGFMIHGDTALHATHPSPENSCSHGCVVLARDVRVAIDAGDDKVLEVV